MDRPNQIKNKSIECLLNTCLGVQQTFQKVKWFSLPSIVPLNQLHFPEISSLNESTVVGFWLITRFHRYFRMNDETGKPFRIQWSIPASSVDILFLVSKAGQITMTTNAPTSSKIHQLFHQLWLFNGATLLIRTLDCRHIDWLDDNLPFSTGTALATCKQSSLNVQVQHFP